MSLPDVARRLRFTLPIALLLALLLPLVFADRLHWQTVVAVALAAWIVLAHAQELVGRVRGTARVPPLAHLGMHTAHLGFAVSIIGICLTSHYSSERDLRMAIGETVTVGDYAFRFDGVLGIDGANYVADRGNIAVLRKGELLEFMHPEKRRYTARNNVMTEAAIEPGLFGDIYVALGEPLDDNAWSVRVHIKPFVRWVWCGALLMAAGGLLAVLDPRYRRLRRRQHADAPADAADVPLPAPPANVSGTPVAGA